MLTDVPIAALEEYSFSDEAAHVIMEQSPRGGIVYGKTINDVWRSMQEDGTYALLPFENSSGGIVWPHLDRLCKDERAAVVGEVQLKVRMCVGGLTHDALAAAEIACSHTKAIEQTSKYQAGIGTLQATKDFPTTVDAVRYVKQQSDPRNVAFASRMAIERLGLTVLDEDIANDKGDDNVTQFFLVRRNGERVLPHPEALYHSALVTPENAPGVLHTLTGIIKNARVDLSSIQSRNIGRKKYQFFLEMTRLGTARQFELMAQTLHELDEMQSIRWLGSWDDRFENA